MTRNNGHIPNEELFAARREPSGSSKLVPFALGAIIGGVIGATLALLYAPAEGSELRRGMTETLADLTENAKDIARGAKITAEKFFRDITDADDEEEPSQTGRTRARADDIMEGADRAIADARRRASESRIRDQEED